MLGRFCDYAVELFEMVKSSYQLENPPAEILLCFLNIFAENFFEEVVLEVEMLERCLHYVPCSGIF